MAVKQNRLCIDECKLIVLFFFPFLQLMKMGSPVAIEYWYCAKGLLVPNTRVDTHREVGNSYSSATVCLK